MADIGCGAGYLSESMARLGARVTGVDMSEGQIEAANKHKSDQKDINRNIEYVYWIFFKMYKGL